MWNILIINLHSTLEWLSYSKLIGHELWIHSKRPQRGDEKRAHSKFSICGSRLVNLQNYRYSTCLQTPFIFSDFLDRRKILDNILVINVKN